MNEKDIIQTLVRELESKVIEKKNQKVKKNYKQPKW
jgi:hypothetical protein